jgi:hypothetical protein
MNNQNNNGNNGAGDLVMRVLIHLVGGRTLSVCPICRERITIWAEPPNAQDIVVEPNRGCGHHFHQGYLSGWFETTQRRHLTCSICRGVCTGYIYINS